VLSTREAVPKIRERMGIDLGKLKL